MKKGRGKKPMPNDDKRALVTGKAKVKRGKRY
jgi:hypothetical protein